jgi:hypothetical protein
MSGTPPLRAVVLRQKVCSIQGVEVWQRNFFWMEQTEVGRCLQKQLLLESADSWDMKRLHYIVGLLGVLAFVLTGQVMRFHKPAMESLDAGTHMMFVSRHIYILGSALVNLVMGLYLCMENAGWRRKLQVVGSGLLLLSPILLTLAFVYEPQWGLAGRSGRASSGMFALLGGVVAHFFAKLGAETH